MKKYKSTFLREVSTINEASTLLEVQTAARAEVDLLNQKGAKCILLKIEEVEDEVQDK